MLALLTTSIPLAMTMTSSLVAVNAEGDLSHHPSAKELSAASSVHVLAFSSLGNPLVVESEGDFSMDVWEEVYSEARRICLGPEKEDEDGGEDVQMEGQERQDSASLQDVLRSAVQSMAGRELKWKESLG